MVNDEQTHFQLKVVGQLVHHSFGISMDQANAWENQISELQSRLEPHGIEGDIIFEYDIVHLGNRSER